MRASIAAAVLVVVVLLGGVVALGVLQPGSPSPSTSNSQTSTVASSEQSGLKGVTFSPATYDLKGISDFFPKAPQAGQLLEWAGDWQELAGAGTPATLSQQAAAHGMEMMVVVQFFQQSTGALIRPLNSTNEQNYVSITRSFAQQHKPAYFGVGIEVNILYEKNASDFQKFVSLYGQVYAAVKSVSPGTSVFTVFQLERMNGLDGGLYGGTNDPNKAEWQLLSLFRTDVAAFTNYPGLIYQDPSEMPTDYYSRISSRTNESVGFTEVGWHSGNVSGGWGSSESEQANFAGDFFTLTSGIHKAFSVWTFLYDQGAAVPFNSMGLLCINGTAKESWQSWLAGK